MTIKPFDEPIYVTRPLLPPLPALQARLAEIWEARWLTNDGQQHVRLTQAIADYLAVPHVSLFNNGTIALLAAVRALGMRGEVITTPFTFPATPHAISWSGATPVFCDIDPVTMNLDPAKVEELITPRTTGILAVHVYGIPCDVYALQAIANRRGLKLVYDAAHAFGTKINGVGIGNFGDASMFSFHATKLFHSAEGGALTAPKADSKAAFDHLKNFGILNQEEVDVVGINGKMNELQAALGLAVLDCVTDELRLRRAIIARYRERLAGVPGLALMPEPAGVESSCQYFVVRIDGPAFGRTRDEVFDHLKTYNVLARKYFYPLCTDYGCYRDLPSARPGRLPVASEVVTQVLCLPLYGTLALGDVDRICDMVLENQARA
ncbi:MAG: DegT/DnrJ/EryC1/StrS family aminotransferase [Acidobacteriota bacterium]|nr:DegT/DnrJ/EryC1/StrS family aminotransferase [Acidobacteriota bacterium]